MGRVAFNGVTTLKHRSTPWPSCVTMDKYMNIHVPLPAVSTARNVTRVTLPRYAGDYLNMHNSSGDTSGSRN